MPRAAGADADGNIQENTGMAGILNLKLCEVYLVDTQVPEI